MNPQDRRWLARLISLTGQIERYAAALRCPGQATAAELINLESGAINAAQEFVQMTVKARTEKMWFAIYGEQNYHAAARLVFGKNYDTGEL